MRSWTRHVFLIGLLMWACPLWRSPVAYLEEGPEDGPEDPEEESGLIIDFAYAEVNIAWSHVLTAAGTTGPGRLRSDDSMSRLFGPRRATWVEVIRDARQDLAAARARYEEARKAYSKMKQRRKARGARKETLVQERDEAAAALVEAFAK